MRPRSAGFGCRWPALELRSAQSHAVIRLHGDVRKWLPADAVIDSAGAVPIEKKFARPEIMIPVKCNRHPWMKAYIGVTSNPFYAVTGADGTFTLKGLPPGEYTIEAWTATYGAEEQRVTVRPDESATVYFDFKGQ